MGRLCARRHWHWALCFIRYIYIPLADLNVYYIHTSQTTRALTDGSFRRHRTKFCCNFAAHHFAACICSCMVLLVVLVYIYSSSGGGQKRRARLLVVFGARKTAIARRAVMPTLDAIMSRNHVRRRVPGLYPVIAPPKHTAAYMNYARRPKHIYIYSMFQH